MAREFVLNPDTNKAAVQVVSYQDIERSEIEASVANEQATNDSLAQQISALQDEKNASDGRLADSKSELDGIDAITPSTTDAGAEGAGSENTDEVESVEETESEPQYAEI